MASDTSPAAWSPGRRRPSWPGYRAGSWPEPISASIAAGRSAAAGLGSTTAGAGVWGADDGDPAATARPQAGDVQAPPSPHVSDGDGDLTNGRAGRQHDADRDHREQHDESAPQADEAAQRIRGERPDQAAAGLNSIKSLGEGNGAGQQMEQRECAEEQHEEAERDMGVLPSWPGRTPGSDRRRSWPPARRRPTRRRGSSSRG